MPSSSSWTKVSLTVFLYFNCYNFSPFTNKNIFWRKLFIKNHSFEPILSPYKKWVTEKRTYVNKLKLLTVLLSISLHKLPYLFRKCYSWHACKVLIKPFLIKYNKKKAFVDVLQKAVQVKSSWL